MLELVLVLAAGLAMFAVSMVICEWGGFRRDWALGISLVVTAWLDATLWT